MALSIFVSSLLDPDASVGTFVDIVADMEERGFHGVWASEGVRFDPIAALAVAGARTSRIGLGTAVVRTWPRHPVVAAQAAQVANAVSGGRFRLGIGPGHAANVAQQFGIELDRPVSHLREYVEITRALLQEGTVDFEGERYRASATLRPDGLGTPVLISALSEQMCRLGGRVADGLIVWLAPPSYIESTVVPMVRAGADRAGRPPPPIVVGAPATASTDRGAVRAAVRELFAVYPSLPFYAALFRKAGLDGADAALTDGWSDAMVDGVIPAGDETALAGWVDAYRAAGADEVVLAPFGAGTTSRADTVAALAAVVARARP